MPGLWVLTDADRLGERMPRALVRALRPRGIEARVVVADGERPSWRGLAPRDLVVARTRCAAGLALVEAAALHGARCFAPAALLRGARNQAPVALTASP